MKYVGENALKKWTSLVKSDIKKKLDKNQGTANSGKILGVDASGEVAPTDTEIATLVDVPNGIVKGDGSTLSAAVAGTDYMAPVTGGTTGQVLTKTADGQEWKDREKDMFVVNMTINNGAISSVDKTFDEVCAAYNTGKTVIADVYASQIDGHFILPSVTFKIDQGIMFAAVNISDSMSVIMRPTDITIQNIIIQNQIIAKGILKGNGNGRISSATAGTDYVAPNGDASNITAAFTAATTRANIATGEKLSVLFGKIAKWFSDLGSLAFKSTVAKSDLTSDVQTSLGKADSALQSAPNTTSLLKGNGSGGLVAASRGSDYIASGNIVKQTLVASESTPTENYAINWVYG